MNDKSITAARASNNLVILSGNNSSTARSIPYAERYRAASALIATPAEKLQEAAQDEAARQAKRRFSKASTGRR